MLLEFHRKCKVKILKSKKCGSRNKGNHLFPVTLTVPSRPAFGDQVPATITTAATLSRRRYTQQIVVPSFLDPPRPSMIGIARGTTGM